MVNIPLFHRVMKHVYTHPEEWDQDTWGERDTSCGTTFCIAGHVANFAALERKDVSLVWVGDSLTDVRVGRGVRSRQMRASEFATQELGLHPDDSYKLFRTWRAWDVWRKVAELTNGEVTLSKIAAEVAAEEVRHRSDEEPERHTDDESDSEDTEPRLKITVHEVPSLIEAVAGTRVTA